MIQQPWVNESRKILVCADSYEEGVLKGRIFNPCRDMEPFSSLSQLLIKVEQLLDEQQMPQSYTEPRTFSSMLEPSPSGSSPSRVRRGARATFELQVIFRQHTSWQGLLQWREGNLEQSFRSVLELVLLMDSALRGLEGGVSA